MVKACRRTFHLQSKLTYCRVLCLLDAHRGNSRLPTGDLTALRIILRSIHKDALYAGYAAAYCCPTPYLHTELVYLVIDLRYLLQLRVQLVLAQMGLAMTDLVTYRWAEAQLTSLKPAAAGRIAGIIGCLSQQISETTLTQPPLLLASVDAIIPHSVWRMVNGVRTTVKVYGCIRPGNPGAGATAEETRTSLMRLVQVRYGQREIILFRVFDTSSHQWRITEGFLLAAMFLFDLIKCAPDVVIEQWRPLLHAVLCPSCGAFHQLVHLHNKSEQYVRVLLDNNTRSVGQKWFLDNGVYTPATEDCLQPPCVDGDKEYSLSFCDDEPAANVEPDAHLLTIPAKLQFGVATPSIGI
jgi:hypothetical protein